MADETYDPDGVRTYVYVGDRELLALHVAGDHDAFGELFARHRDRLWAVALRTMGNPEDAADGLQDALIAAYRRAGSFRGDAAVTTWLHRVVVNACLDRLRAAKVRAAAALPDDADHAAALMAEAEPIGAAGASPDPEAAALGAEQRSMLRAGLAKLPEDQRLPIVLVDVEGLTVAEASALLEVPEGTIKSRCARGRRKLAASLIEAGWQPSSRGGVAGAGNQPRSSTVPSPGSPEQSSAPGSPESGGEAS